MHTGVPHFDDNAHILVLTHAHKHVKLKANKTTVMKDTARRTPQEAAFPISSFN